MNAVRNFAQFLGEHRRGALHDEITAALNNLVEQVMLTGKAGKLTVELTLRRYQNQTGGVCDITDNVKVTPPKVQRDGDLFFVTEDGVLTKDMPQKPLPIGAVSIKKEEAANG